MQKIEKMRRKFVRGYTLVELILILGVGAFIIGCGTVFVLVVMALASYLIGN